MLPSNDKMTVLLAKINEFVVVHGTEQTNKQQGEKNGKWVKEK